MHKLFLAMLVALPLAATSAHAAGDGKSPQNNKMKTCSADFKATGQPSSERRAFMSTCMKGSGPAMSADEKKAKKAAFLEKKKSCSTEATAANKKGAERKAMMKSCLKA